MTPVEFRSTYSYKDAIGLGPQIVEITEELPAHEQTGLMMQLHRLMLALPAAIASDLTTGSKTRMGPFYELVAAIDLIDRIYPALDTADTRHDLMQLGDRISGAAFTERPASHPGEDAAEDADDAVQPPAPAGTAPAPSVAQPTDHAAPAPVAPAPQAAPAQPEAAGSDVPSGWEPQGAYRPQPPHSPEAIAAAAAARTVPLTADDPGTTITVPFGDGTPEPTPRSQAAPAPQQPAAPVAVPLVKIDPVSALPTQRVPSPQAQGTTVHVQPNSFQ